MMLVNAYFKWPQTTFKKRPPPTHTPSLFTVTATHAEMTLSEEECQISRHLQIKRLTTKTLSRSEYFSYRLKRSLHYVFSPLCLCVLNSIKPLKRGMSHSTTQTHSVGGATNIHSCTSTQRRPAKPLSNILLLLLQQSNTGKKNIFKRKKKSDKIDTAKAETTQNKAESKRLGASVKGDIQAWPKPGQSLCHNSHIDFFHSHLCCGSSQLVMGVQPTLSATRPAFCSHLMSDNPT